MRNKIQSVPQQCARTVQSELDGIESKLLKMLFGKECLPDKTALILSMFGINPNVYIKKFEEKAKVFMKEDGSFNGALFKKVIQLSKYSKITDILSIPETDFFLSDYIESLVKTFFPGGKT